MSVSFDDNCLQLGDVAVTTVCYQCFGTLDTMLLSRKTLLVSAVGLLFGYTLTYFVFTSLFSQLNTESYIVPSSPHSHGEMDQSIPALSRVRLWHDFDESSHISMSGFYF